jgi:hypothetical protein
MNDGLHQLIARKREILAVLEGKLGSEAYDVREQHGIRVDAEATELELVELCAAANAGELLHGKMEEALEELRGLRPKTREQALAVNAGEIMVWRLRGHLGPAEAGSSKVEVPSSKEEEGKEAADG